MIIKNKLVTHIKFFLINKLFLLRKEVYYIKWSMNYIKTLDIQLNNNNNNNEKNDNNDNNEKNSQFIKDCELIIKFINMIDANIKNILNKLSDDKLNSKTTLELIILFDCINERINNSILKKFDYVYKAYENLVLSYNHLYIPTTSVSKLAKTPNLMLFFNKKLNNISKIFSKLIKDTDVNFKNIFSTWNFISTDHLADFYDEENKIYLELSFWLYEMPIFHCIAIHEIYHKYYFDENNHIRFDEKKDLSFFKENLPEMIKADTGLLLENFSENFIMSLYQEILADLHTYMFTKENYVYTLFINGFLSEFNHSFLKIHSSNKNLSNEEKCCFERIKDMSIYNFDFKKKQILYFVRLFLLLKFIKKYDYEVYKKEIIQFIESVLLTVFPDNDINKNKINLYENFDNFLKDFVAYKMYKKNKYIIFILVEIYYRFLLHKGALDIINKRKKEIGNQYCSKYIERFNEYLIEIKELENTNNKNINSNKFIRINHIIQEKFRKHNIEELKIEINNSKNDKIYFLTNIKVDRNVKDAFLLFKEFVQNNEFIQNNEEENNFYYGFGPFDFVTLIQKTGEFIENLDNFFKNKNITFFIDNHSLFEIKTYNENKHELQGFFNLLLSIDIKNAFSDIENENNVIKEIDKKFQDEILKKYKGRLFLSMGNENLVILIYNIIQSDLETIIDHFHNLDNISHISSTILLNEKFFLPEEQNTMLKDLIILVKLKPNNLSTNYEQLCKKIKELNNNDNIRIFKKLGVYDTEIIIKSISISQLENLIEIISNLSIDIQIEKEIKVNC